MKKVIAICLYAASLACHASETVRLPMDVVKFIEQRDACDYLRGEDSNVDDRKRLQQIIRKANSLCRGSDRQLATLRNKYASNDAVIDGLNDHEETINARAR